MELLFVCHANVCRSPMAERLARMAIADNGLAGTVSARSAGTHAVAGAPMHPAAVRALREVGADAWGFTSRRVTREALSGAGLVLTASRTQRAACVTTHPAALARTFTLRQFGRLAAVAERLPEGEPADRLAALLAQVPRLRAVVAAGAAGEDDLADPTTGTEADVRACRADIATALGALFGYLTGC